MSSFCSSLLPEFPNFVHLLIPLLETFVLQKYNRMSGVRKCETWLKSNEFSFTEDISVEL